MTVGLTQGEIDLAAGGVMGLLPAERFTYISQPNPAVNPVTYYNVPGYFSTYRQFELVANPVLHNSRRLRLPRQALPVNPSPNDTVVQDDGTAWNVNVVESGLGRPYWLLQVQQVG